jgi:hypothetical protein
LTFGRLQRHAVAFVDTPDTVINRALDALEQSTAAVSDEAHTPEPERRIDPRMLPNLRHTKVLGAKIEGEEIARANWNLLVLEMLHRVMKRVGNFDKLRQLCPANIIKGRKEDDGYSYVADLDLSVQGQDANGACRTVVTAAQGLGIALEISFMWRQKEGAAHPGEMARIHFPGTTHGPSERAGAQAARIPPVTRRGPTLLDLT